jgi:hypothetical protein
MSTITQELVDKLIRELEQKRKSRDVLLDQLGVLDAEIDLIDKLIKPLDEKIFNIFEDNINPKVLPVKEAYDARIAANCRSKIEWSKEQLVDGTTIFKVVENLSVSSFTPYFGLKFFQKPMDREYGTKIKAEFIGSVEDGNTVIAVTDRMGVPKNIDIGNTITDSLDLPEIFSLGNLPKVIGFGTTSSIGIITTLIGGIEENSNIFHHFGLGDVGLVDIDMVLSLPDILPDKTKIVGIGTGTWPIEYFDETGTLSTRLINTNTLILDKNSLSAKDEDQFFVGILTNYPAIFLSTSSASTKQGVNFKVLRIRDGIDEEFDYTSSPNAPLKIGIINENRFGIGNSAIIDNSGFADKTETWNPSSTYINPILSEEECSLQVVERRGVVVKDITENSRWDPELADGEGACIINPEPEIGAGAEEYFVGDTRWPVFYTSSPSGGPQLSSNYASLGQTVLPLGEYSNDNLPANIGYVSVPPGGFSSNCDSLDEAIDVAVQDYENAVETYRPEAEKYSRTSTILRKERDKRQLYAWSILQSASKLLEEIKEGELLLEELDKLEL